FVKLLDFGISKLRGPLGGEEGKVSLTSTGMVMGTPQYIAPEQAYARSDLDHRVDIYAMGVILYEMLTGELPFSGDTALELMMKHVQDVPEPPRRRRPDLGISERLEAVVLKALQKDRDERFGSAQEMLDALPGSNELAGGYASIGTASTPLVHVGGSGWPAILVGLALLLVGLGYFAFRLLAPAGDASSSSLSLSPSLPRPGKAARGSVGGAVSDGAAVDGLRLRASDAPRGKAGAASDRHGDARSLPRGRSSDVGRAPGLDVPHSASQPVAALLRIGVHPKHAHVEVDGRALGGNGILRGPTGRRVRIIVTAKGYRRLTRTISLRGDRTLNLHLRRATSSGTKAGPEGDLKSNPYQ
ncbi:MAG: protein kinase, partial [Deltaproteobacteria bacterium]|nr:protein kinase [Deltaproteobacteria bacterium]